MSRQNIYDSEEFFCGYWALRQNPDSANELEEKPALFTLLGSVEGKRILDLGCGYGENCKTFVQMGATAVTGLDLSKKMLTVAKKENCDPKITYLNLPMEELYRVEGTFDLIVSSLAIHYVKDYPALVRMVFSKLSDGGTFVFSQEHPLTTAPRSGASWSPEGDCYYLCDYALSGQRKVNWFVDGVLKYHRTFSDVINALTKTGFSIAKILEPVPDKALQERLPQCKKELHKPNFLLVKAIKK